MILVSLLPVVVDEFLDVGLDEPNLGEDLIGGGGQAKGLALEFQRWM